MRQSQVHRPRAVVLVLALAGSACEQQSGEAASGAAAAPATETGRFHGVEYTAPTGTSLSDSGVSRPSHYPDPETGQVVTIPTRIEPAITLIMPGTSRYHVEIKKPPERVSLADMTAAMRARPEVSQVAGTTEPDGWRLRYLWTSSDGSQVTIEHRRFALKDSDYECVFDTGNSKDVAAARAICDSIRPAGKAP